MCTKKERAMAKGAGDGERHELQRESDRKVKETGPGLSNEEEYLWPGRDS